MVRLGVCRDVTHHNGAQSVVYFGCIIAELFRRARNIIFAPAALLVLHSCEARFVPWLSSFTS